MTVMTDERTATEWRSVVVAAIAIVGVAGVVPLVVAHHFGAFGIPRNDDWVYLRAAFQLAHDGTLDGANWISANTVGQLVASVPVVWVFGESIRALQAATLVAGVIGVFAVFDLGRRMLSFGRSLFVALLVAVGPLWAALAASAMTDVPALACAMVCLALGARSLRVGASRVLLPAALVVGFVGFTVREYAIAAPLAIVIVAFACRDERSSDESRVGPRTLLVTTVVFFVAAAVFYAWRLTLPHWYSHVLHAPGPTELWVAQDELARAAIVVGLLVLPAVVLAGPLRAVRVAHARAPRTTGLLLVATGLWLALSIERHWEPERVLGPGNYVSSRGALRLDTITGERHLLFDRPVLVSLAVLGACSVLGLVALAIPVIAGLQGRVRDRRVWLTPSEGAVALVALAACGYAATFSVSTLVEQAMFDRYLLPIVPLVAILALRCEPTHPGARRVGRVRAATVAFVGLAALGAVFALNAASFDGTKWKVAEQARSVTGRATDVDGGYEWTGYHGFFRPNRHPDTCIRVTAQLDEPEASEEDVIAAESVWGIGDPQTWIVARQRRAC